MGLKKLGYSPAEIMDAPKKQEAREELYSILKRERKGTLLTISGPRAHETITAMRYGFDISRIICVDENAGTLASHTKDLIKRLNCTTAEKVFLLKSFQRYTGFVSDVSIKLARQGRLIQVAHLDFCAPIFALTPGSVAIEIPKFIGSGILQEGLLAITVESGHDPGCYDNETRYRRMNCLVNQRIETGVPRTAKIVKEGSYTNPRSNNTMLWGVFQIRRK